MAPDRGQPQGSATSDAEANIHRDESGSPQDGRGSFESLNTQKYLADRGAEPQNFTLRGVLVGLIIGVVICFSNMYFGLQTGWVSSMAMPSALMGFAYFKTVSRLIKLPFSPVENVLVQSVAGSVGTMPLGCGFVGVIPALNFLLKPEENGPLDISLWKLIVWAVGICFFGVVFAVPLRRQVIIREKLKFPSGTATALMIKVLHGDEKAKALTAQERRGDSQRTTEEEQGLLQPTSADEIVPLRSGDSEASGAEQEELDGEWKAKIRLLLISFAGSAVYVRFPSSTMECGLTMHRL